MNHKIVTTIIAGIYGLDCLIITPYILYKGWGIEVGLLTSWGYNNFGLGFFYVWFIFFSIFTWFLLKYFFMFLDWRLKNFSKYPKWVAVLSWVVLMSLTIRNNIGVVKANF